MDGHLTPALERVTASVLEAQRKRRQLEEELASAAAAVASLQKESASFEFSVLQLRKELAATLDAKRKEEQALEQVSAKKAETLLQIDELNDNIKSLRGQLDLAERNLDNRVTAVRSAVSGIEDEVKSVKSQFASFSEQTKALRETIAGIQRVSEAALAQLADVDSKTTELNAVADAAAARLVGITASVDRVQKDEQPALAAAEELQQLAAQLASCKTEAESAVTAVEKLARERERTAAAIAEQLAKIDELCAATGGSVGTPPPADVEGGAAKRAAAASAEVAANGPPEPGAARNRALDQMPVSAAAAAGSIAVPLAQTQYAATHALLELLGTQGFLSGAEAASGSQQLEEGGVDKLVRAWWSRAMASPAPGYYRLVLGQALAESGDSKGALTFFNRAMEGRHVDPFITYLVARALLEMKRYVDVLRIAQGLGKSKNGKAFAANVEALHLAGSRRYDEAEGMLAQALAMPGLPKIQYSETLYNLGCVAHAKGDARAAAAWFERLYSVDPGFRDVGRHIKRHTPVGAG
jgi:predicted  nucleic acid-binding Zn-ribbon protein